MSNDLTESHRFALLADRRRRVVIRIMREPDTAMSVVELAKRVEACEDTGGSTGDFRSIQSSLHHVHLPKLEAAGVVQYDTTNGTVSPEPALHSLGWFLESLEEADRSWSDH